mgnify:CR=1 FL=1
MNGTAAASAFGIWGAFMFIVYGLFLLLGLYALYLFIKLATRGIQALDIYLDEKKNRRP